jgi:hypothetical protein
MSYTEARDGIFNYDGIYIPESVVRELALEGVAEAQETLEEIDEKIASHVGKLAVAS